jgi:2-C-methyl-D-erythritol 4-phosphate cytidylyltransferase
MTVGGIILAGGKGSRFRSEIPKQFLKLCGKIILEYSVEKFSRVVGELVVVSHSDWINEAEKLIKGDYHFGITAGGPTRQLSVLKGLEYLSSKGVDIVAIHDGVRPLFTVKLLKKAIACARKTGSAIPAIKICNTIILSGDGEKIDSYLDRDRVYQLQTPQVFRFDLIYEAHTRAFNRGLRNFTDDSRLFEMQGLTAAMITGEESNIKITTPDDLAVAAYYLKKERKWENH